MAGPQHAAAPDQPRSRRRTRLVYLALFLASLVLGAVWAISSPVSSSPDDDFHLASIWCANGSEDLCRLSVDPVSGEKRAEVPATLSSAGCYVQDVNANAQCTQDGVGKTVVVSRVNDGLYPPHFYSFLAPLASTDTARAVVVMRVTVLVSILLIWGLALLAAPALRASQILAWAVGSVPLGLFLYASTNPSAWAVAGVAALWPATWAAFQAHGRRSWLLAAGALIAAMVMATARADSAAMAAVFLIIVPFALARQRKHLIPTAICWFLAMGAVLVYRAAGQSGVLVTGMNGAPPSRDIGIIWTNLISIPGIWAGAFGTWGLGWLEVAVPQSVWVFMMLVVGGLVLDSIRRISGQVLILALPLVGLLYALPLVMLVQSGQFVGQVVQPRYMLPLILVLLGVLLSPLGKPALALSRSQRVTVGLLCTISASAALHQFIRRYATGTDIMNPNLDAVREWWWAPVISPMGAWVLGSVAAGVIFTIAVQLNAERSAESGGGREQVTSSGAVNVVVADPTEPADDGQMLMMERTQDPAPPPLRN